MNKSNESLLSSKTLSALKKVLEVRKDNKLWETYDLLQDAVTGINEVDGAVMVAAKSVKGNIPSAVKGTTGEAAALSLLKELESLKKEIQANKKGWVDRINAVSDAAGDAAKEIDSLLDDIS